MTKLDLKVRTFIDVYNDYFPIVYGTVYSRTGHAEDTREITQEVFARFFEKFETVNTPRTWLFGTMRNVLLEHYRSKRGSEANIDDVFNDVSLTFVNGFRDTRLLIEEAMESSRIFSDERERAIFDLIAVNRLSCREAGSQLGLSERQVRYKYEILVNRFVQYFNQRGIKSLEDLL